MKEVGVYDSSARLTPPLEELTEAFRYRHLIWEFTKRDIVTRYKRSALGVVWAMLNPLGTMLIMTVVFSQLFRQTAWYPIYVLTGLIVWNFFAQTTAGAPLALVSGGPIIHKVYVPRTVFALTTVGAGLVNLILSLVPLGFVMLVLGRVPHVSAIIVVPYAIVLLAAFALGIGLLLSTWVVRFADVQNIYTIFLTAWMYLSAVFYPYEVVPAAYRWWFFNLNPIYHLLLLFRDPLYYGNPPTWSHLLTATAVAVGTLMAGWIVFTRRGDELAYRI